MGLILLKIASIIFVTGLAIVLAEKVGDVTVDPDNYSVPQAVWAITIILAGVAAVLCYSVGIFLI